MDAKTSRALEASIQHWRENITAEKVDNVSASDKDCALCRRFKGSRLLECEGCPVAERTGMAFCKNSPYWDAAIALSRWIGFPTSPIAKQKFKKAAQAELDFLISLREDKEHD